MKTGDIILIPFPFAEFTNRKVRPAAVVCKTKDKYEDLVICAISSVTPQNLTDNEILLELSSQNGLRKTSVLKIDRILTAKKEYVITRIGELDKSDLVIFKAKFKELID